MKKTMIAAALLVFGQAACASGGSAGSAALTPAEAQYLYGYFAGQPMRDAPDTF